MLLSENRVVVVSADDLDTAVLAAVDLRLLNLLCHVDPFQKEKTLGPGMGPFGQNEMAYVTSSEMPMMNASMMTPVMANTIRRFQAALKPTVKQLIMNTIVPMKVMRTVMWFSKGEVDVVSSH